MRLIDADALHEKCDIFTIHTREYGSIEVIAVEAIGDVPTVDAVPVVQFDALKKLVSGEWVECELVQEAMGIDFNTGFKMFDFGRTAEWNPAPLNGQKITTKFRLKNSVPVVHGRWIKDGDVVVCSECGEEHAWAEYRATYCEDCGAKMDGGNEE